LKGGRRITYIVILAIVGIAVASDLKSWKIPNWLVLAGIATGCFISVMARGIVAGMKYSMIGLVIPVVVLILLFFIRALGAGDIKLLASVGTFVGTDIGLIILYSFISGGVLAIYYIIKNLIFSAVFHSKLSKATSVKRTTNEKWKDGKHRVHFSIAILAGVIIYFLK
jgi:prepilin peptidase CpaA